MNIYLVLLLFKSKGRVYMKKGTKITLIIGGILIVLIGVVGITYAFFSTGGAQETSNSFQSGCLNISLTDASSSISLTNTYPVTDVEGLEGTSYDFTITNTCNTSANYEINLESINEQANSLNADYIKVALSSDTVDNVISKLSSNTSKTPTISNAYEAYNLYTGTLNASEEKTYHLKLWLDYDATVEVAANKVYSSKINVVANPEIQVVDTLEATFELNDKTITSNLSSNVTSATYCVSDENICTPSTSASISANSYRVELEGNSNKQMVCTKLNNTSKVICSNPAEIRNQLLNEAILANATTQLTRTDFSSTVKTTTTGTIYKSANSSQYDNNGEVYYFAGNPTDNWVKFANKYWRIIRINGDGSIRLIYQGTSANTTGTGTQATTSAYNSSYNNNAYVGYMYTSGQVHGTGSSSTIKGVLDSWYQSNLSSYASKIDGNAGFCGDRSPSTSYSSSNGSGGTGTTTTYYGGYIRLARNQNSVSPSFKCSNSSDLYTTGGSSDGNRALTNPIGLSTADEVVYAGGSWFSDNNSSYYLYTGQNYWTMSPLYFSGGDACVFSVYSDGNLVSGSVSWSEPGVRPVINLKASVTISGGSGTSSNPYVIS